MEVDSLAVLCQSGVVFLSPDAALPRVMQSYLTPLVVLPHPAGLCDPFSMHLVQGIKEAPLSFHPVELVGAHLEFSTYTLFQG